VSIFSRFFSPRICVHRLNSRVILSRGCVTPDILVELGGSNIENTSGYKRLTCVFLCTLRQTHAESIDSPADQKKVRLAIASRRIAPQDVTRPSPTGTPGTPVQPGLSILDAVSSNIPAKRRVVVLDDEDIQPVASGSRDNGKSTLPKRLDANKILLISVLTGRHIMASSVLNALDEPERGLDNQLDECVDELYCMVQSSIVGMQYYTGTRTVKLRRHRSSYFTCVHIGMVGPGEEVSLIRESNNPYDGYV
jgi:SWI/SNF-related matrix-associated actin-dependent regulator of chromatin subfamily A3